MTEPELPSDPSLVLDPILYLWSHAPASLDGSYAHVVTVLGRWLAGEDPFPDPPPDDEGHRPSPPKPDPPTPAYPIVELLVYFAFIDTASTAWFVVGEAYDSVWGV